MRDRARFWSRSFWYGWRQLLSLKDHLEAATVLSVFLLGSLGMSFWSGPAWLAPAILAFALLAMVLDGAYAQWKESAFVAAPNLHAVLGSQVRAEIVGVSKEQWTYLDEHGEAQTERPRVSVDLEFSTDGVVRIDQALLLCDDDYIQELGGVPADSGPIDVNAGEVHTIRFTIASPVIGRKKTWIRLIGANRRWDSGHCEMEWMPEINPRSTPDKSEGRQ